MSVDPFQRLKQIFNAAIDLTSTERAAYLDAQRDLSTTTRRQIEELLLADVEFHAAATRRATPSDSAGANAVDWTGRHIGAYRIDRLLGHGGMGTVLLAHRVDGVTQKVAIKVVRPERADAAALTRFRLERQVLALLQHPNIAPLLDLGELPDGSPYIVMAYVEGMPIDRYADETPLDLNGRLHLFLQICDAITYAHRNLIVHRDLKPSNVLVDGDGRPQLIDFGIAKPLGSQIGTIDIESTEADQRFLSLSHASPEQLAGEPVTTACDVYGLGVLLYELLSGRPPFYSAGQTPAQLAARIAGEDPLPPSLARDAKASGYRIPRDVDLIVLRCLRKRPADRYVSVDQLGDDIRRYLDGRPVLARRGNLIYRAGRFVARHRVAAGLAAVLVTAAAIGGTVYTQQQTALVREQQRADDMTSLITDALRFSDPGSGRRDISAREVFERVAAQAQASPGMSAASRAHVLGSIAQIDLNLGLPGEALALLSKLDLAALDSAQREDLTLVRARAQFLNGALDAARAEAAQGLARSTSADQRSSWQLLDASIDLHQGDDKSALAKVEAMREETWPTDLAEQRDLLYADVLTQLDRNEEALVQIRRTFATQRARLGTTSPMVFDTTLRMAKREVRLGNVDQAIVLRDELLVIVDRFFSRTSLRHAAVLALDALIESRRGNLDQAIERTIQSQQLHIDQLGENQATVASAHLNLASLYEERGDHTNAAQRYRTAVTLAERLWTPSDSNLLLFRTAASNYLAIHDQCAEASAIAGRALADVYDNNSLHEYDIVLLTVAVADYCQLENDDSTGQRAVVARDLHRALTLSRSSDVKQATEQLAAKAKTRGIVLPP